MNNNFRNYKFMSNNLQKNNKVSLFLRNKDYYILNLMKKRGRTDKIKDNRHNSYLKDVKFPLLSIKKIVKLKGKNGFYSFKKLDIKSKANSFDETNNNSANSCLNLLKKRPFICGMPLITPHKKKEIIKRKINNPLVIINCKKNNDRSMRNVFIHFSPKQLFKKPAKKNIGIQKDFLNFNHNYFSETKINKPNIIGIIPRNVFG